jgi:hypothetical protein
MLNEPIQHSEFRTQHSLSFPVVIGEGSHPFPFRTRKLSSLPPMVLHAKVCGRVGHCRDYSSRADAKASALFLLQRHHLSRNGQIAFTRAMYRAPFTFPFPFSLYFRPFTTIHRIFIVPSGLSSVRVRIVRHGHCDPPSSSNQRVQPFAGEAARTSRTSFF